MSTRFPHLAAAAAACALALSAPSIAHAAGIEPGAATPVQREQAQARFLRGKDLKNKQKLDEAIVEFRASLDIVASPNTRLELARCLRDKGRLVEAYVELGRTAVEAKELLAQDTRYAKASVAANAERQALEPSLGFVTITIQNASDATTVTVAGEEIRRAAWSEPVPLMPGTTEIAVASPGHAAVKRSVTVAARERTSVTIDASSGEAERVAAPAPPVDTGGDHSSLRPFAYVAGGIGVAGLVTSVIAGSMAQSTYNDLEKACHGPCTTDHSSDISSGKTKEAIANVGLALGIVGVAAGVVLYVVSKPKPGAAGTSAALVVWPGGIGVKGEM
jgi:hypothetical protein